MLQICGFQLQENLWRWWSFKAVTPTVVLRQLPGLSCRQSPTDSHLHQRANLFTHTSPLSWWFYYSIHSQPMVCLLFHREKELLLQKLLPLPPSSPASLTSFPEKRWLQGSGLHPLSHPPLSIPANMHSSHPSLRTNNVNTFYQLCSSST